MTLSQLRVLLAIVDHGGFTAAAEHLGVSQPSVSRAIATIEDELRTAMFARNKEGIVLTEAGRLAAVRAREALRQFDLLHADVAAAAGHLTGTLRFASLPSATGTLVASQVRIFTLQHPQVHVRLFEGTDQEVRRWVSQGAAELGVVTLPAPEFQTIPLGTDEFVAVLPVGHALSADSTITFDALANHDFILSTGGCGPLIEAGAHDAGTRLRVAFEARELSAILAMVAEGLGVSIVPTLGLPTELERVVMRPLQPRMSRTLAVAHLPDPSPAARAFLHQLARSTVTQIAAAGSHRRAKTSKAAAPHASALRPRVR
jgi:DNA-binding transcriptional LysR family regulator